MGVLFTWLWIVSLSLSRCAAVGMMGLHYTCKKKENMNSMFLFVNFIIPCSWLWIVNILALTSDGVLMLRYCRSTFKSKWAPLLTTTNSWISIITRDEKRGIKIIHFIDVVDLEPIHWLDAIIILLLYGKLFNPKACHGQVAYPSWKRKGYIALGQETY